MKKAQLITGIVVLVFAALMLFLDTGISTPVAITLMIVGMGAVATARVRKSR